MKTFSELFQRVRSLPDPWARNESAERSVRPYRVEGWESMAKEIPTNENGELNSFIALHNPNVSFDLDTEMAPYTEMANGHIHLPPPAAFNTPADFYSTLFHEMGHATQDGTNRIARFLLLDDVRADEKTDMLFSFMIGREPMRYRVVEEWVAEMVARDLLHRFLPDAAAESRNLHYLRAWYDNAIDSGAKEADAAKYFTIAEILANDAVEFLLSPIEK